VLAANDDVVDFKDTLVAGNGTHYAGGVTSQSGTSTQAVRDSRARGDGVMGGTGNGSAPSVDLSRPPALAGGSDWDCPFPFEAEDRGIDQAVVALRVEVAASGDVIAAKVARDPGAGFGREAQRCALRKRWSPGLDRAGKPTSAVAQVNVRFRQ
jgi:protein TonB